MTQKYINWILNKVVVILFCFLLIFIFKFNNLTINCFSIKGVPNDILKEIRYKNILLKCSSDLPDALIKSTFDNFYYKNFNNVNKIKFSITKYCQLNNNKLNFFSFKNPYSHFHLHLGCYNNLFLNLQFSHNNAGYDFNKFTEEDLLYKHRTQYLDNCLRIYNNNLIQLYLNYYNIEDNKYNFNINSENSKIIQNYLNEYDYNFKKIINNNILLKDDKF